MVLLKRQAAVNTSFDGVLNPQRGAHCIQLLFISIAYCTAIAWNS
ncbi:hypothetical protein [Paracoccus sp. SSK6]